MRESRKAGAVRKSVLDFARWLRDQAATAARSPSTSADDKARLKDAIKQLDDAVDNLIKIIDQREALMVLLATPGSPEAEAAAAAAAPYLVGGDVYVSMLLSAAVTIGSLALGPAERAELRKKLDEIQAARKQQTKRATDENRKRWAKSDAMIRGYLGRVRAKSRWGRAGKIRERMLEELGDAPTQGTIVRAIKRISDC